MADTFKLVWDETGKRSFETGTKRGVLYPLTPTGYVKGVAWSGLTGVTEQGSGGDTADMYADDILYASIRAAEKFGGTITAFTYPDEFKACNGEKEVTPGAVLGQQARATFGLSFRTMIGTDTDQETAGYKIHLIYGASVSPSEKAYQAINNSPNGMNLSWTFTTVPVAVTGNKPVSLITIDSRTLDAAKLTALEKVLYGTAAVDAVPAKDAALPTPDELITLLTAAG